MRKKHFFLLLALWSTIIMYAQNKIDLAGEWKFAQGEHPAYNDRITLPGSMLQRPHHVARFDADQRERR